MKTLQGIITLRLAGILFLLATTWLFAQQASQEVAQSTYQQAEKAFQEQRLSDAAEGFAKLAELVPKTAEVHAKLGLIYYLMGRFGDAVPAFQKALDLKPELPNAGTLLAICLAELGRYQEALPALEHGFENPPDKDFGRLIGLELHRSYVGLERHDKAAMVAIRMGGMFPDDPEVLFEMGRYYGDLAAQTMRRLSEIAPDSVFGHQAAGEAHESRRDYGLAVEEYRKALALAPRRPGLHFRIGRAIQLSAGQAGSLDDALREFQNELQIDPSHSLAAYEIGEIYRRRSQLAEARGFLEQAVTHRPDFEEARIALARVLRELNEPQEALPHLETAVRLNANNEVSRYQLALVYRALGDGPAHERELREFQRLRAEKADRGQTSAPAKSDVTHQQLDGPDAPPQASP